MLIHVFVGAVIGALAGYLLPPGGIFWFVVGGICGYFVKQYSDRRY